MKVGVVGLGKVGLPLALVLAHAGRHDVVGFDLDLDAVRARLDAPAFANERGWPELASVARNEVHLVDSPDDIVKHADVVLVVVQTPHAEGYGGDRPMPGDPRDFEYGYLETALGELNVAAATLDRSPIVGIVSTVLPRTTYDRLQPKVDRLRLGYCPAFISLGTTVPNLLHPEFTLVGADDDRVGDELAAVFEAVSLAPVHRTSIISAELLKVSLNAFISTKIVFANALMELAWATGADVDEVTSGLALSDKVTSAAYLRAGLGDGGACRPRDVIALSWFALEVKLSNDLFGALVWARVDQSQFIAELTERWASKLDLPIIVLGEAYKPGTAITDGSAARLLAWQLDDAPTWDPVAHPSEDDLPNEPAVYVLATPHPEVLRTVRTDLAAGSVIIDPWRVVGEVEDVTVIGVGGRT